MGGIRRQSCHKTPLDWREAGAASSLLQRAQLDCYSEKGEAGLRALSQEVGSGDQALWMEGEAWGQRPRYDVEAINATKAQPRSQAARGRRPRAGLHPILYVVIIPAAFTLRPTPSSGPNRHPGGAPGLWGQRGADSPPNRCSRPAGTAFGSLDVSAVPVLPNPIRPT